MLRLFAALALAAALAAPAAAQTLEPARLPGMCVTISAQEGSISRPCDKSAAQTFNLPVNAPGPIRYGAQCLAPRGGGLYPQLYAVACDGSPAQTWTISADGHVRNGEDRCLSLLGLSSRTGERVYGGECPRRNEPQQWRAVSLDQEIYDPVRAQLRWREQPELCLSFIDQGDFIGLASCSTLTPPDFHQVYSFDRQDMSQFRSTGGCLTSNVAFDGLTISDCRVARENMWVLSQHGVLLNQHGRCAEPRQEGERWVVRMTGCTARGAQRWDIAPVTP